MFSNHLGIQFSEAKSLTFDYDYLNYKIDNPAEYRLSRYDGNQQQISGRAFESGKVTPFDFHVLKTDYSEQLKDNLNLQFGAKATFSDVSNFTHLTDIEPTFKVDDFFTDDVGMNERILAAYASIKGNLTSKNAFTAGLRFEDYNVDLTSQNDGILIDRRRGRFYPTLSLSHQFTESKSFSITYNERVNRPGFQVLAPAFYFFDVNTVLGGNVQAVPTTSKKIGADLNLNTLFISFSYTDENNPISWGQPELNHEKNILILRPQNTPDRDIIALNISFPIQLTSFWSTQWNFNLFHRSETAIIDGSFIENNGFAGFGNFNQNFKLSDSWEFELTTRWNSTFQTAMANVKPRISSNMGLQKKFKNGSRLSLSWNDIFNTGSFFGVINDNPSHGIYYDFHYELDGNIVRVAYSMPFGNSDLKVTEKTS